MRRRIGMLLVLVAACTPRRVEVAPDASPAPTASALKPSATTASAERADYPTLRDALADGDASIGKTVLTQAYRRRIDATTIELVSCWDLPRKPYFAHELHLRYPPALRRELRTIRRTLVAEGYRCPRVVFRLAAIERSAVEPSITFEGTLERVFLDIPPASPPPLPAGVDYVSFDDIDIDGDAAAGKIAELPVSLEYRGDPRLFPPVHDGTFSVGGCGREEVEGGTEITVHFAANQKREVDAFADSDPLSCEHTMRLKLRKRSADGTSWDATLLGVARGPESSFP